MLWSAFLLCFLRSGEITIPDAASYDPTVHLNFQDISIDNPNDPKIIYVKIKASKTDPFRQGVNVHIGRTNNAVCPAHGTIILPHHSRTCPWPIVSLPR